MHFNSLILLACLVVTRQSLSISADSSSKVIKIYTKPLHRGQSKTLKISGCVELEGLMDNSIESVDTLGNCFTLFDDHGCIGDHIDMKLTTPAHWNLAPLGFENKASSIRQCANCTEMIKKWPLKKSNSISLYLGKDLTGEVLELKDIQGCQPLPEKFQNKVMSAKPDGNCYEIHKHLNCTGGEALELSPITQNLTLDLKNLHFHSRTAAISLCHYECWWNQTSLYIEEISKSDSSTAANESKSTNGNSGLIIFLLISLFLIVIILVGMILYRRWRKEIGIERAKDAFTFSIIADTCEY